MTTVECDYCGETIEGAAYRDATTGNAYCNETHLEQDLGL